MQNQPPNKAAVCCSYSART